MVFSPKKTLWSTQCSCTERRDGSAGTEGPMEITVAAYWMDGCLESNQTLNPLIHSMYSHFITLPIDPGPTSSCLFQWKLFSSRDRILSTAVSSSEANSTKIKSGKALGHWPPPLDPLSYILEMLLNQLSNNSYTWSGLTKLFSSPGILSSRAPQKTMKYPRTLK